MNTRRNFLKLAPIAPLAASAAIPLIGKTDISEIAEAHEMKPGRKYLMLVKRRFPKQLMHEASNSLQARGLDITMICTEADIELYDMTEGSKPRT